MGGSRHSLVLIGCGPGIGRSIASVFASKRYDTIGLVARRQSQLDADRKAVEAVAPDTKTHTYVADIADGPSLKETLKQISHDIGIPETVYFNAAVIRPTSISDETEEAMIYDFKVRTLSASWQYLTNTSTRSPIRLFFTQHSGLFPSL